jgi:hypothetical protein
MQVTGSSVRTSESLQLFGNGAEVAGVEPTTIRWLTCGGPLLFPQCGMCVS